MITYVKKSNADKYSNLYEKATQALRTHTMDGEVVPEGDPLAIMPLPKEGELDNAITSLEEYFSYIVELNKINSTYTILPLDEEVFDINLNTRAISIPAAFVKTGGVQADQMAELIVFEADRYFDYMDLANTLIYVQW